MFLPNHYKGYHVLISSLLMNHLQNNQKSKNHLKYLPKRFYKPHLPPLQQKTKTIRSLKPNPRKNAVRRGRRRKLLKMSDTTMTCKSSKNCHPRKKLFLVKFSVVNPVLSNLMQQNTFINNCLRLMVDVQKTRKNQRLHSISPFVPFVSKPFGSLTSTVNT